SPGDYATQNFHTLHDATERQAKCGQPLFEVRHHPPRVRRALEARDEIIGIAHDQDSGARVAILPELQSVDGMLTSVLLRLRGPRFSSDYELLADASKGDNAA
ncbi:MAG: hypothetical protein ACP5M5_14690, partial [Acidibrevibacterium sp.]|uniref:hypothetical protein n=1 Tax=Acidibrevibacterium sp. TaxID=2606776 RepID=UPI003CFED75E